MSRRLVATRRRVAPDRLDAYRAAWERLAAAVGECRGHAWVFRAADGEPLFIEFLEFGEGADPRGDEAVVEAYRDLEALAGRADSHEWIGAWPDASERATEEPDAGP